MERIAHRGARTEAPENTVAAFERAFQRRADAIELDVHATRDGIVVVHHDPDLAPGVNVERPKIAEMTWEEVAATYAVTGISVPTLAQVLAVVPLGKTVYVEIKGLGIEQLVANDIRRSSARCAVHAFDHATIARFVDIAPEIPRGLLFESDLADMETAVARARVRDIWPQFSLIDSSVMTRARAMGVRVIGWTVNERDDLQRLGGLGVDGICTDDVRLLDA
jgi:glycerophosphoryl diester phosphodiesterase